MIIYLIIKQIRFLSGLQFPIAKNLLIGGVISPYKIDSELEKEFLNSFGYVDTLDQVRAWVDIKDDLVVIVFEFAKLQEESLCVCACVLN